MDLQQTRSLSFFVSVKGFFYFYGLLVFLLICSGCAQHPAVKQRTIHFIDTQLDKHDVINNADIGIDFARACQMAVAQNESLLNLLMQRDLTNYDIDQANSEVWPRLELQVMGQVPFGDGDGGKNKHVRGGLYLRYDFHKALFKSDAAAAARAIKDKQFELARGQFFDLSYHLLDLLIEISIMEKQLSVFQNMVSQAQTGFRTAEKLHELRLKNQSVVWQWDSIRNLHQQKLQKLEYAFSKAKSNFKFKLGLTDSQDIIINNLNSIIKKLEEPIEEAPGDPQFMSALLNKHPECRAAVNDLFLAEMAILNAMRQRVPKLSGSIGLGSFQMLSEDDKDSPGTLELTISMPFWDWGDIKRDVKKAERKKEWAQRQIQLLTRRLSYEIVTGQKRWQHAQSISQQTRKIWQEMTTQAQENDQLHTQKGIQPLDSAKFQLEAYNAQIEYLDSMKALYKSAAALKKRLGIPSVDNLFGFMEAGGKPDKL